MSDQDIIELLFKPALVPLKIYRLYGRGVGLDVEKLKLKLLAGNRGKSELGKGFIIRLPLTLAIIQALMVRLGEESMLYSKYNSNIEGINVSDIQYVQTRSYTS